MSREATPEPSGATELSAFKTAFIAWRESALVVAQYTHLQNRLHNELAALRHEQDSSEQNIYIEGIHMAEIRRYNDLLTGLNSTHGSYKIASSREASNKKAAWRAVCQYVTTIFKGKDLTIVSWKRALNEIHATLVDHCGRDKTGRLAQIQATFPAKDILLHLFSSKTDANSQAIAKALYQLFDRTVPPAINNVDGGNPRQVEPKHLETAIRVYNSYRGDADFVPESTLDKFNEYHCDTQQHLTHLKALQAAIQTQLLDAQKKRHPKNFSTRINYKLFNAFLTLSTKMVSQLEKSGATVADANHAKHFMIQAAIHLFSHLKKAIKIKTSLAREDLKSLCASLISIETGKVAWVGRVIFTNSEGYDTNSSADLIPLLNKYDMNARGDIDTEPYNNAFEAFQDEVAEIVKPGPSAKEQASKALGSAFSSLRRAGAGRTTKPNTGKVMGGAGGAGGAGDAGTASTTKKGEADYTLSRGGGGGGGPRKGR